MGVFRERRTRERQAAQERSIIFHRGHTPHPARTVQTLLLDTLFSRGSFRPFPETSLRFVFTTIFALRSARLTISATRVR